MSTDSDSGGLAGVDKLFRDTFVWYPIAKKDFKDAIRSQGLWILSAVFTVLFVSPVAAALYFGGVGPSPPEGGLGTRFLIENIYLTLVTVILPIVVLFVGVASITKEKTSGSLKILLSLPFSRQSVLVGKVVGRSAVVAVPFIIAASITAVFLVLSRVSFDAWMFALFMFFSLLFALVMVSIAVSVSGAVSTTLRSIIANSVIYLYITFAWNPVVNELGTFLKNDLGVSASVRWHTELFLKFASPTQSYKTLVRSLLAGFSDGPVQPRLQRAAELSGQELTQLSPAQYSRYNLFNVRGSLFSPGLPSSDKEVICENLVGGVYRTVSVTVDGQTQSAEFCTGAGDIPFYFSDPAVVVFMLGWIGVAAAFSYYTFNQIDL